MTKKKFKAQTNAIREGKISSQLNEHSEALFLTSSFRFTSAEQAAARFDDSEPGFVYSRYANPTVQMFEDRLSALEGSEKSVSTSSGMAAILSCVLGICKSGDRIVASQQLFGATLGLFNNIIAKFGVDIQIVNASDPAKWAEAAGGKAALFFLESPSNPQLQIYDIRALADVAHDAGALLVVDNCICTPILQKPLDLGADICMHSATKYIDGQGRVLGGALCASEQIIDESLFPVLKTAGPSLSPFNAWVLLKGLETLSLRVNAMSDSAEKLVAAIEDHPAIAKIYYPFHHNHKNVELAKRQQKKGGGIVTIDLAGGKEAAFKALNATSLVSITPNFGDAKSTVTHPASTTHLKMGEEQREIAQITDGMFRISVGLEDIDDIIADVKCALDAAT